MQIHAKIWKEKPFRLKLPILKKKTIL